MTPFYDVLHQVVDLLQREGRVSYRAIRRHFELDDEVLEDLKFEIVQVKRWAVDRDGEMLVWAGGSDGASALAPKPEADPHGAVSHLTVIDAERRQLTVMFCDMVNSTPLANRLDPEDYREVVGAFQSVCAEVIQHFDGYVAQVLGDGLLVYFGYPMAHEDDAWRAVLAGHEIIAALRRLNAQVEQEQGVQFAVRVGIHTGPVVVGVMGRGMDKELALGATPNVAARIQAAADPNEVVFSEVTYSLIQDGIPCEALGPRHFKGFESAVSLYRVLDYEAHPQAGDGPLCKNRTPLVGRDDELSFLLGRWKQLENGNGQVVMLCGEPGIGKSRIVQEFQSRLSEQKQCVITLRCSPYFRNTALHPFIEEAERSFGVPREDPAEVRLAKLERALAELGGDLTERIHLFALLLSVPLPEGRYPPLGISPLRQRRRTEELLIDRLLEQASAQVVLVVFEDLHWADPSTLELLALLFDQVSGARMLFLLTFRPEFKPPWASCAHFTQLTLVGLASSEVTALMKHVAGGRSLPDEVRKDVVAKTDGVPLFVEELTKMVLESGLVSEGPQGYQLTDQLDALDIPVTLRDSLMARLDRLGEAKEVAQLGATLGREFSYELIHAVTPLDEGTLRRGLHRLVESELIYQRGLPPEAGYAFKHVLIQNEAYQSLLKRQRQAFHEQIARTLREQFPDVSEAQPELLAYHCTEAGLNSEAVTHWARAGEKAILRSAHVEGVRHLAKGLKLCRSLPDPERRSREELRVRMFLGPALIAMKGYGAPEVERSYARARQPLRAMESEARARSPR